MADKTSIEWTDATWSPLTGCSVTSPGCTNCYAMRLAGTRLQHHPSRKGLTTETKAGPVWNGKVRFNEQWLNQPSKWTKPRKIFVCAHSDIGHNAVTQLQFAAIADAMSMAPWHEYQILTKRPQNVLDHLLKAKIEPRPNWLIGVSVEDQKRADERRASAEAIATLGWRTFVSYEPALGLVDWTGWEFLAWMISGGESGPGARPSHPDWHRAARDFCAGHGIPYLLKQHGAWATIFDRDIDDPDWSDCGRWPREHPSGQWLNLAGGQGFHGERVVYVNRVGKKSAGRLLDGVEHSEFPRPILPA